MVGRLPAILVSTDLSVPVIGLDVVCKGLGLLIRCVAVSMAVVIVWNVKENQLIIYSDMGIRVICRYLRP